MQSLPQPSKKGIEELQLILERIHGRPFSYEEAAEIGTWWLGYVSKLVDNKLGYGREKGKKVI